MPRSILIIDDDKNIVSLLKDYATEMGGFTSIVTASDGSTASTKLMNQKFDVILMDLNLPKKSGEEIIKEIFDDKRALNKIQDILVISGTLDKTKLSKIIACGCKNFLTKPFDEKDFKDKVQKIIDAKKA